MAEKGYDHRRFGCVSCNRRFDAGFSEEPSCPDCGSTDLESLQPLPTIKEMSGLVKDFHPGQTLKEYMDELSDDF